MMTCSIGPLMDISIGRTGADVCVCVCVCVCGPDLPGTSCHLVEPSSNLLRSFLCPYLFVTKKNEMRVCVCVCLKVLGNKNGENDGTPLDGRPSSVDTRR